MSEGERPPFLRRHRLALQALALVTLLLVPVLVYWAAQAAAGGWLAVLMVPLGAGMLLAVVAS